LQIRAIGIYGVDIGTDSKSAPSGEAVMEAVAAAYDEVIHL